MLALILAFLPEHDQHRLHMPDPWSYEVAATQFSEGKWVLTDDEMAAIRTQARILNAPTPQYIHIGEDAWAFRQAAGHPFEMVVAQWLWHSRLVNALLAVLATLALYPLLVTWYSERLAFIGVSLLLFSPISLTALHYYNMDTFAGGMWPLIGGSLLLWYEAKGREGRWLWLLLLAAGWALGWAVVVRITNLLLLALCGVYLLWLLWPQQQIALSRKGRKSKKRSRQNQRKRLSIRGWDQKRLVHLGAFCLGCFAALTILALYNRVAFGNILDSGYLYSSSDDRFYLWNENPATSVPGGVFTWLAGGTLWHIILTPTGE